MVPPNSPAMWVCRPSFTGKMNASEPGVWPGIAIGVTVTSPSVTGCPSARTRSRFGLLWLLFAWFGGRIRRMDHAQSAAVVPTFVP